MSDPKRGIQIKLTVDEELHALFERVADKNGKPLATFVRQLAAQKLYELISI